ncbi:MAG: prolyl-tRNA synthetase [Candidatus Entotheonella factor]|uniref:Prolyl-tRNA synthetase n=1 Tax=Entotheonella factor TaxID=1429438 RepID=W4LVU3_ENTF1|nr:MAG: prolyl-tRNA synthetase [Candidatus Entotheonella factor]
MHLPSHQYLDDRSIPYQKLSFSPETKKGAAHVANVLGYSERQMVKSLIFVTSIDEKVLVMLGGDQNAISGHLKKAIGSRNIKLASPNVVQAITGYAIGSIPPFHWQSSGFRSFIDASLMQESVLGVGAGEWGQEILMAPEDLVKAAQATIVNLCNKLQPVFESR